MKNKVTLENILNIITSIVTILGVSLISTLGPIILKTDYWERKEQEKLLQTINVTESKDYINNILGVPKVCTSIEIPLKIDLNEQGEKAVYSNKFYTLVCYFKADNSLLGYLIIQKDKKFNPILYRNTRMFSKKMNYLSREHVKKIIAMKLYSTRNDTSGYYISFYHHHLATHNCFIGVGVSYLGYLKNEYFFTKSGYDDIFYPTLSRWYRTHFYDRVVENYINYMICNDDYTYLDKNQTAPFEIMDKTQTNTFANFMNDSSVDILALLKNEINTKLSLSYSENAYLNDNIN